MGDVYGISSINGSGTGELLDALVGTFKDETAEDLPDIPRLAVIGRPNVGKSSLINALLDEERTIVTPVAGTTRDTVYTRYNRFGFDFLLVDTAGLRKKTRVRENIEFYSVMRTIRAIEHSDICLLMTDATEGFDSQDLSILRLVQRNRKGVVILVNKWDLVEKSQNTHKEFEKIIRDRVAPFSDIPIVFTSATEKQRIFKAIEVAAEVSKNRSRKIPTAKLNDVLLPLIKATPPPIVKDKTIRIKYITQLKTGFPAFAFFCNLPQYVKDPYKRFLENKIRENFDFSGVPMEIYLRKK
jgi:GTP-binding protein